MKPFVMERWQSLYENRVRHNLSESGVHPLTLAELLRLAEGAEDAGSVADDVARTQPDGPARTAPPTSDVSRELLDTLLGYGQSNGTDPLRRSIARLYQDAGDDGERRGEVGPPGGGGGAGAVDPDRVVVTNGSAEANFIAAWRLVEAGDEVAILTPTYGQVEGIVEGMGARVRRIPLRPEHGWQPDPDEIRSVIGNRTRMVVVTNPQNPTGVTLGDEALRAILDAADRTGAWVLADEVYSGAERAAGAPETPSLLARSPRVLATGSLSKAYGLPGLRLGWIVAPEELATELWARKDYTTISPGALTDALARIALRDDVRPRIIRRTRSIVRDHFDLLARWFRDSGHFDVPEHDAGAVCFARFHAPIDSATLAERLRTEQDVLIVPGAHFGIDSYLRFGFGIERTDLEAALERVGRLFERM